MPGKAGGKRPPHDGCLRPLRRALPKIKVQRLFQPGLDRRRSAMGGAVILNWVLGAIIIVLIVGGGLYAALRHGKAGPDNRDARRYFRAKDDPQVTPLAEHVPTERVAAAGGLTQRRSPRRDASPERDASPDADAAGGQPSAPLSGDQAAEPGRTPQ
jgi:hypothetical protein